MTQVNNGTLKQNSVTCSGHTRPVVDLKFSKMLSNGAYYLITASKDGIPMLRFGHTGDWIGSFIGHKGAIWACCISDDGLLAATGAADFSAKIWDTETGKNTSTLVHSHIVRSVEFNRNADKIITTNNKYELLTHDLKSETEIFKIKGHTDTIKRAIWFEDDKTILSISHDKTLKIWDLRASSEVYQINYDDKVNDVEIVGNNLLLTTDSCVILSEISSLSNESGDDEKLTSPFVEKDRWRVSDTSVFNTASLHPNFNYKMRMESDNLIENYFVCGTQESVYKYNTETGNIIETCKGHFGPIHCIRYSPDGHLFASGSEDGTIRLWQNYLGEQYGLWYLSRNVKASE